MLYMSDLIDPTIDLFLYDLKNALNTSKNDIDKNENRFKARLPDDNVKFQDNEIETAYLELTDPIQPDFQPNNKNLQGYFYAVRLNDTYGLQLQCSLNNKIDPQSVDQFTIIKTEIEQKLDLNHNPATIGKTWLLSGYLPQNPQLAPETIALKSYQALVKDGKSTDLYGQGIFLEGNLFEFWKINSISSHQNNHFIVAIFPNKHQLDKFIDFYKDWMGLFCFRHKISWAYQQSRSIKESLVEHYKRVDDHRIILDQNKQDLILNKSLNNIQSVLNKYTLDLLKLSFQKQVISINLVNYQTRLAIILEEAEKSNNLQFFNNKSFPCNIPILKSYIVPIILVIVFGLFTVLVQRFVLRSGVK